MEFLRITGHFTGFAWAAHCLPDRTNASSVRVVPLRRIDARRNIHGEHAQQKTKENMENRMADSGSSGTPKPNMEAECFRLPKTCRIGL